MPYLKEYNLLFIHIPKTGGSSVEDTLGIYHKWDDNILMNSEQTIINGIRTAPQHWTPDLIINKLGKNTFDKCIKFTIVRNPYTRLLSEYFYFMIKKDGNLKHFNKWLPGFLSKMDHDHKLPQYKFIEEGIDFIAHTETIQEDWGRFIGEYNLNINPQLSHKNKTKFNKSSLIKEITPDNIDLINQVYKQDFIEFGYDIINP